jgi:hypothetical protein
MSVEGVVMQEEFLLVFLSFCGIEPVLIVFLFVWSRLVSSYKAL